MSLRGAAEAPLVQGQVPVTAESRPVATTPRLLYVVSEDWYFLHIACPWPARLAMTASKCMWRRTYKMAGRR